MHCRNALESKPLDLEVFDSKLHNPNYFGLDSNKYSLTSKSEGLDSNKSEGLDSNKYSFTSKSEGLDSNKSEGLDSNKSEFYWHWLGKRKLTIPKSWYLK